MADPWIRAINKRKPEHVYSTIYTDTRPYQSASRTINSTYIYKFRIIYICSGVYSAIIHYVVYGYSGTVANAQSMNVSIMLSCLVASHICTSIADTIILVFVYLPHIRISCLYRARSMDRGIQRDPLKESIKGCSCIWRDWVRDSQPVHKMSSHLADLVGLSVDEDPANLIQSGTRLCCEFKLIII